MAATRVGGKNGAVSFISGHVADFAKFTIETQHPTDDDTSYIDVGSGSSHAGSGTVDHNLTADGFLKKGAASTSPGLDDVTATGGVVTVTSDTGCTHSGTFIIGSISISHSKRAGAIGINYRAVNDGDLTETWAVS